MTDFVFMEKTHPNKMLESLNRLWLKKELCDVILCCGGKEFPCHRNVLASFSSYFEAMFTTGMTESRQERVDMVDVEPQAMEMLLSYAYTSEVVSSTQNVQALLAAAHLLNVTGVQEACCRYMENHMDEKNCVGIHCLADTYSFEMLEKRSRDYILDHFSVVYQQEEFLSLSVDKLTEILASDKLNVTKEDMAFDAAMLWLNHSPDRKQSFEKVIGTIRLAFINPSYLDNVNLDAVESQACQRPISEDHKPRWSTISSEVILRVVSSKVDSFHPQANRWKTLTCVPITVEFPGLVVSGSTVYLAGGGYPDGKSVSKKMWSYNSSCDSWLSMAPMNKARMCCGLVMLDGYVFAVGGYGDRFYSMYVKSVERYNPSANTWQLMDSAGMPDYCTGSPVVALDGFIYVIDWDRMFKYNPNTSVWTDVAPKQVLRCGYAVCTLKGKIYVIGGEGSNLVECYNPETNQWSMCSSMKKHRMEPGVAVVDGKIYVLGGMDGMCSNLCCIESFNDQTNTWEIVGEMPTAHRHFSCVSLWMS